MPRPRRPLLASWIVAAAFIGLAAPVSPASGAVTIGQTGVPTGTCGEGDPTVQATSAGTTYGVPAGGGVITSWSQLGSMISPGRAKLIVWRSTSVATDFEVVAKSDAQDFAAGVLLTFQVRIPVRGGDLLGIRAGAIATDCFFAGGPGDSIRFRNDLATDPDPLTGSTQPLPSQLSNLRTNLSAVVEPDADADGFGDDSQDQCPTDPSTQGACPADTDPPETTIVKRPPNSSERSKAKFKFSSDEAGSTFECRLKNKDLKPSLTQFGDCDSPRTFKHLDFGKFRFQVRATDTAGNVDQTPAKDKFRLVE